MARSLLRTCLTNCVKEEPMDAEHRQPTNGSAPIRGIPVQSTKYLPSLRPEMRGQKWADPCRAP
ncbi:unnamed protein product [Staurois parvus]|uniref:Uncharacterized protein n=1 Tax=Staurois parvus TaxID=386267 RepID=A0ABN9EGT3_9NEOB|nr:unnamed protein product [Staurois parvus]